MCGIEGHTGCKAQVLTGNGNEENLGDLEGERREQIVRRVQVVSGIRKA